MNFKKPSITKEIRDKIDSLFAEEEQSTEKDQQDVAKEGEGVNKTEMTTPKESESTVRDSDWVIKAITPEPKNIPIKEKKEKDIRGVVEGKTSRDKKISGKGEKTGGDKGRAKSTTTKTSTKKQKVATSNKTTTTPSVIKAGSKVTNSTDSQKGGDVTTDIEETRETPVTTPVSDGDNSTVDILNELFALEKTMDYSLFKYHPEKRNLDFTHIQELIDFINNNDAEIPVNPIVVNSDMVIMRGQRMFEALKMLDKPIYYIVNNHIQPHAPELSSISRPRELPDYLKRYKQAGKVEYVRLADFMNENHVELELAMALTLKKGKLSEDDLLNFKEGIYKATNFEHATAVIAMRDEIRSVTKEEFVNSRNFVCALCAINSIDKFSGAKLIKKIRQQPKSVVKSNSITGYRTMLSGIYNYQNKRVLDLTR
jgi:hypothetical protein